VLTEATTNPDHLFRIQGKVALVTGGARGIGLFAAEGLVRSGVKVYISSRDAAACDAVAQRLSQVGACHSLPCNLLRQAELEALAARLTELEPRLDILVNNSGSFHSADFDDFPESGWDDVMDLNLKATFFLTQKLAPALRAAGRSEDPARVINISSIAGVRAYDNATYSYMASKAAVNHLTRALGARLARDHITVNAIAPGPMAGGMMVRTTEDEAFRQRIESGIPLRRTGSADDMTGVVRFLCSRASAYLTGVVIPLDGGSSTCV
jgi:NAD(P)-dependent dehydrogenase (short-subunit alcohol dehydrogenase family)